MLKTKHKIKESILNLGRRFNAYLKLISYKGEIRSAQPPEDYKLVFEDNFDQPLDTKKWRYGMRWGDFHPDALYQYFDTNGSLSYVSPEGLVLELRNIPKKYIKSQLPDWRQTPKMPDEFTIPTGIGIITSIDGWQYGWFEAWVKLPKGQSYWPAFWLSGVNSWPPEIDIFEAYTEQGSEYGGKFLFWKMKNKRIQPNLHYGVVEEGTKKMYGPYDVPVADCTERFVQYACHWEKDFIRIYYDGILAFETKDPDVLKWYNREKDQMLVILNHGRTEKQANGGLPQESAMIVKSFRVWQRQ